MDAPSRLTLGDILNRFGFTMLAVAGGKLDPNAPVNSVDFYDSSERVGIAADAFVLGIGLETTESIAAAMERLAPLGVAALVVRVADEARPYPANARPLLLELNRGASWAQLATLLSADLDLSRRQGESFDVSGDSETSLFELANSLAGILGGPVTIEDMSSRILAFSADQGQADEPRKQSVLGRQVSRQHNEVLEQVGVFTEIYSSPKPVFVPSIVAGSRPRSVMRVRAGRENLGSIWAIVEKPLSEAGNQAFIEGANVVALSMVRRRVMADAGARLRATLVAKLIEGGEDAVQAAVQLGTVGGTTCVVAVAPIGTSGGEPQREAELEAVARSLTAFLAMAEPRAVTSLVGRTIYAVLPVRTGSSAPDPVALAREFLRRGTATETLVIGISDPAEEVANLAVFRRQADLTLRALRLPRHRGVQVAVHSQIQVDALLLRVGDLLAADHEELGGPLTVLTQHDEANAGSLVATVAAYLDTFGDVGKASAVVHVHANTFRYRLRRIEELTGVSLGDPDTRMAISLQLRMAEQVGY